MPSTNAADSTAGDDDGRVDCALVPARSAGQALCFTHWVRTLFELHATTIETLDWQPACAKNAAAKRPALDDPYPRPTVPASAICRVSMHTSAPATHERRHDDERPTDPNLVRDGAETEAVDERKDVWRSAENLREGDRVAEAALVSDRVTRGQRTRGR